MMKRILLNWYYHRYDLTDYLLGFAGELELVFLFRHFPDGKEPAYMRNRPGVSVIYWGQYATPYALLQQVKPDLVVFADLESFNQIALNIAARNRGISTCVLQHGFRGAFEVDEALDVAGQAAELRFSSTSLWSFRFLFSALRPRNLPALPKLAAFVYARKRGELTAALYRHQFELRRADHYIEFSEHNTGYHRRRDGVPPERFILTGNPVLDEYFQYFNTHRSPGPEPYCLLIDCPYGEANFIQDYGIGLEEKNAYLRRLADWAHRNGCSLKVKLHPLSYNNDRLYEEERLTYYRDADLKPLVAGAAVVFFVHFSSLAPAILACRPAIYFHAGIEGHARVFRELGVTCLDLFSFDATTDELSGQAVQVAEDQLAPYLYRTDGQAAARVKEALLNL